MSKIYTIKKLIVAISILFLSTGFLGVGMLKLIAYPSMVERFTKWSWPLWAMYIIGIIEFLLALMIFYKKTRAFAAKATCILMIGALLIHIYFKEYNQLYGPAMVLVLLVSLIMADDLI